MIILILIITVLYVYEIFSHEKDKKKLKQYRDKYGDV